MTPDENILTMPDNDFLRDFETIGVAADPVVEAPVVAPVVEAVVEVPVAKKKLSYKLQRELEAIPAQIDSLETQLAKLHEEIAAPSFYQNSSEHTAAALARLDALQLELDTLLERWAELDA